MGGGGEEPGFLRIGRQDSSTGMVTPCCDLMFSGTYRSRGDKGGNNSWPIVLKRRTKMLSSPGGL